MTGRARETGRPAMRVVFARALALFVLGLVAMCSVVLPAAAAQTYSVPMATVDGRGTVTFHVTLGVLVEAGAPGADADRSVWTLGGSPDVDPHLLGLYRSYPSKSAVPLSETYRLAMLQEPAGVVLSSYKGVPLLVLHGHLADGSGSYALRLTYATNIVRREYDSMGLLVEHPGRGQWWFANVDGQRINRFVVTSDLAGVRSVVGMQ